MTALHPLRESVLGLYGHTPVSRREVVTPRIHVCLTRGTGDWNGVACMNNFSDHDSISQFEARMNMSPYTTQTIPTLVIAQGLRS